MWKSLLVVCFSSSVLFAVTFADCTETPEEISTASASASSSSYSDSKSSYSSSSSKSSSSSNKSASESYLSSSSASSSKSSSSSSSSSRSSIASSCDQCGKNERYVECPSSLCVPKTCDQLGKPIACPRIIPGRCPDKPACVCNEGYVRNNKGVCIPKSQCPSCGGDKNAQAGCSHLCSEQCGKKKPPKDCPCEINGCVCKPGFIYDGQQNKCVKRGQCSVQCKQNEVYTSCANGGCGKWNCTQYRGPDLCIDPIECIGGCVCKKDYLRAPNGTCIPQEQCPAVQCPKPNEIYDTCPLECPPRKCGIDDRAVLCLADQPCLPPGCRCKDGYYRNDTGICVTWEECNQCCKNERYVECPSSLCVPKTCDQLGKPIACPRIIPGRCPDKPACVCNEDYVRNKKGVCIPKGQCSSCGGDKNAQAGCGHLCSEQCGEETPPIDCRCEINGCVCKPGFIYDRQQNKCVKRGQCSVQCKQNEVYTSCANGGCGKWNCTQYGGPDLCIDPIECIGGCVCKKDYLRAPDGTCIPQEQCPAVLCPKPNEIYDTCPLECPPRKCGIDDKAVLCLADQPCLPPGCRCKDGYYRNDTGICVTWEECNQCCENERYVECPSSLCVPKTCDQLGKPIACPRIIPGRCPDKPACVCNEDYVRNKKGVCIPISQCPSCGGDKNALAGCGHLCSEQCGEETPPIDCRCEINGCVCKPGFIYDRQQNKCVKREQCSVQCKQNEVYTSCSNGGCGKRNCTQYDGPDLCIDPIECFGGCICKEDYLRAPNGTCIPQDQCPAVLCPKQNEVYDTCPLSCPPRKCGIDDRAVLCLADQPCLPPGCRCQDGYYRNDEGVCVTWEECPKPCGENEVYTSCANGGCGKWNCTQYGEPDLCIDPIECFEGCICKEDYLRAPDGTCIPQEQCPAVLCPKQNEVYDTCPLECPPRKCGIDDRAVLCLADQPCLPPGCRCQDGYYRNDRGVCVTWEECAKPCEENEVYTSCANGGCGKWNCTQYGEPDLCIDPIECFEGCICKEDYLRAPDGTCIPQEQCPAVLCPKQNEVYDTCPLECPPRKCSIDDRAVLCLADQPCLSPGCRCQDGYYRNDRGVCVTWEECPPGSEPYTCDESVDKLLEDGNYIWTAQFMHEVIQRKPNTSNIMSACSVLIPIAELALYSGGATYDQLMKTLNLRSKDDIRCVFPRFISKLRAEQNIILNIANRIFPTDTYPLTQEFLDDTSNVFDAVAESLDYNKPQAAADRINEWVANETNNRIKNIATPDMFSSTTRLVLANAIYFLGNWIRQFDVANTEDRTFYVNKQKTIQIPTMYQQNTFKYGEDQNLDCQILEMPYKGGNFSFVVYLPNDVEGLPTLAEKLKAPSAFKESYTATSYQKVQVYLPKIKIESEFDLSGIMQSVGMKDVFDAAKSNLTGILQKYERLIISAAKQKSFGLVDENGTEAAAANVIIVGTTSAIYPPPKTYIFDAKQPFLFYIMYQSTYPLFTGTFYGDSAQ